MRMVFMGTPEIAATVLKCILASGEHEVVGVVTQTDKPKGRGKEIGISEVKEVALAHDLNILQPEKASDPAFLDELRKLDADVFCVVAYGKILRQTLLDIPKYGCINVHASLLPRLRGASPIQWAVINGDRESGVTIMHMDAGIDTGNIILQKSFELDKKETAGTLHDKLAELGGPMLLEALRMIEENTAPDIKQNDDEATYVKVIEKSLGQIDFSKEACEIERLIRGLDPWPSAYTALEGRMLKLWDADVVSVREDKAFTALPVGTVIEVNEDSFTVKCGKDCLQVKKLQLEGKKKMNTADFLRGYKLEKGVVLGK